MYYLYIITTLCTLLVTHHVLLYYTNIRVGVNSYESGG